MVGPLLSGEALMKVSPEELKTLMERLTLETLHPYRVSQNNVNTIILLCIIIHSYLHVYISF